jgi:hypothetical protein
MGREEMERLLMFAMEGDYGAAMKFLRLAKRYGSLDMASRLADSISVDSTLPWLVMRQWAKKVAKDIRGGNYEKRVNRMTKIQEEMDTEERK